MRSGGWRPFWTSLLASLLVLVPLVGGTVLLSRQQLRAQLRQAARSESGVPVQLPRTTDQLTVLLCVSGEQPGFVLAYLNASQNCVHLLGVPAVLTVPFADEQAALAQCYAAAGPARCREALMQVLALPEDTRYPGMPMRFCASCRRTLRFRPSAPQRPVQPRGTPFSGRMQSCCPPPCRTRCGASALCCSPT